MMTRPVDTTTVASRQRLVFLRRRYAELRDEFAYVEDEYKAGRLSRADEAALMAAIANEVTAIVRETLALTRPPALLRQGG